MINTFDGFQLIENKMLTKGIKQKKTHKWKWLNWIYKKIYGYENIPDPQVYFMKNKIFGHPATLRALTNGVNKLKQN